MANFSRTFLLSCTTLTFLLANACQEENDYPRQTNGPYPGPGGGGSSVGDGGVFSTVCGEAPATCVGHCQTQVTDFQPEDCCDIVTCNCNPALAQWQIKSCNQIPLNDAGLLDGGLLNDAGPLLDAAALFDASQFGVDATPIIPVALP